MREARAGNRKRPRWLGLAAISATLAAVAGCGNDFDRERVRTLYEVQNGQYADAKARVNELYGCRDPNEPKKPGKGPEADPSYDDKHMLLWRMERGLVASVAGDFAESDRHLDDAAVLVDLRRTVSAAREVGTYLLNDTLREYSGSLYEHAQVDYYRILNHLVEAERASGLLPSSQPRSSDAAYEHYERAAVRARHLALDVLAETRDAAGKERYHDDPFARVLAAATMLALPPRTRDDVDRQFAQVMLRRALDAYGNEREALKGDRFLRYEVGQTPRLATRLLLRHTLAYDPGSYDDIVKRYHLEAEPRPPLPKGDGMLLVLDHVGFVTRPQVLSIGFGTIAPPLSGEQAAHGDSSSTFRIGALGFWAVGPGADVATAWVVPLPDDIMRHMVPGGVGVFGMQLPVHEKEHPATAPARVQVHPLAAATVASDAPAMQPVNEPLEIVSDIDAYARATLKDEQPLLLAKTITRAVTKQVIAAQGTVAAKRAAGGGAAADAVGALVGLVTSAAATFSEQADIRAWTTLPDHVEAALIDLPAGSYSIDLDTGYGSVPLGTVQVPEGQLVVVPARTFPVRIAEPRD